MDWSLSQDQGLLTEAAVAGGGDGSRVHLDFG